MKLIYVFVSGHTQRVSVEPNNAVQMPETEPRAAAGSATEQVQLESNAVHVLKSVWYQRIRDYWNCSTCPHNWCGKTPERKHIRYTNSSVADWLQELYLGCAKVEILQDYLVEAPLTPKKRAASTAQAPNPAPTPTPAPQTTLPSDPMQLFEVGQRWFNLGKESATMTNF